MHVCACVCVCVCVCLLVAWSCPPLCKPMDCSLTGSSVHGFLQARILEWVAIPFSRSSRPRNLAGLLNCRQIFYQLSYPAMPETWVRSLGWEDPLEKGMTTHSSILVWRVPWTVQSMGLQSQTWLSDFHFHLEDNWQLFTKLNIVLLYNSEIMSLGIYPNTFKTIFIQCLL